MTTKKNSKIQKDPWGRTYKTVPLRDRQESDHYVPMVIKPAPKKGRK